MKTIGQLIANQSGVLYRLSQHICALQQIEHYIQTSLPVPLSQHCHLGNFRDNVVIIVTDSPLWATRLRFLVPELIENWQQHITLQSLHIKTIEVQVCPIIPQQNSPPPVHTLSTQTAELLCNVAQTLSHPRLQAALLRLASRGGS